MATMRNESGVGRKLVGDAEANGLLLEFTKVWVIACIDQKTEEIFVFSDQHIWPDHKYAKYHCGSLRDGVKFMTDADEISIHNVMGFDWWVFNEIAPDLWNIDTMPPWSDKLQDTLVQSKVQWYDRPAVKGYKGNHGLAPWGARVGYPKPEVSDWSVWTPIMLTRVVDDIIINLRVHTALMKERYDQISHGVDTIDTYNRVKETQFWQTIQEINGWQADTELMRKSVAELDKISSKLASEIEPLLPKQIKVCHTKCPWEKFALGWNEYCDNMAEFYPDLKRLRKWPSTRYIMKEVKGELKQMEVKPTYGSNMKPFKVAKGHAYRPTNVETGQCGPTITKMVDARKWIKEQEKPAQWKPVKVQAKRVTGYESMVCSHFGLDEKDCFDPVKGIVWGPHTRIEWHNAKMSQHSVVKDYLLSVGWIPTEWNYKKDKDGSFVRNPDGSRVRTSPKLTEDSYDTIQGELGGMIAKYNTLVHRRRTIENQKSDEKGWLNLVREDGRLSAGAMCFATSTGRMAQYGIVNVPSGSAVYGKPMREVWTCASGTVLISADMDSAQLRILANFMCDDDFTYAVMSGTEFEEIDIDKFDGSEAYYEKAETYYKIYRGTDAHTINGIAFGLIEQSDVEYARIHQCHETIDRITAGRKLAKNGIYALLFGAGDEKFARTVKLHTAEDGAKIKQTYFTRMPKLKRLIDRLQRIFKEHKFSKGGFVEVGGGTWLYSKSQHKLLNYMLMGTEAQIQNEAVNLANRKLLEKGWMRLNGRKPCIGVRQLCAYHDELTFESPEHIADKVKREVIDWMYGQASKNLNLRAETLVTGTGVIGKTWLDVH